MMMRLALNSWENWLKSGSPSDSRLLHSDNSDRTDLTIELEYLDDERPASFGVPAFGDGIANIPLEQISNEPDDLIPLLSYSEIKE